VESVSEDQFSTMCSDSTGNMKHGCKDVKEVLMTILDLGDCCHHLQNMSGDINKLEEFKNMHPPVPPRMN
jgi:hypothetical protein